MAIMAKICFKYHNGTNKGKNLFHKKFITSNYVNESWVIFFRL